MQLLLAEDEVGILDGLAAFLRMRGHVVRTASSCGVAVERLAAERFDALITDWRLGDGSGADVLAAAPDVPALIMSGWPEEVGDTGCAVLTKPVRPRELVDAVEQLVTSDDRALCVPSGDPQRQTPDPFRALPRDCRARLQLVLDVLRERAIAVRDVELEDDGEIVVMTVRTDESNAVDVEQALTVVESALADFRVRSLDGLAVVDARLWRDGRPGHVERVLRVTPSSGDGSDRIELEAAASDSAESADPLAIDCGTGLAPRRFLALLDRICQLRRGGREVYLLNLPEPLRLLAETQGRGADLPTRTRSGPRLPPVLQALWR